MKFIIPIEAIKQYKSKQWPQYLAVLTAGFIAFSCGLHFAWPSPSLPILLSEDYPLEITSEEASYIAVIGPLGDIVGAPIAAILAERIGRKNGILMTTIPLFISWLIIAFANSSLTFCIGRFIGGIGDGFLYIIFPMYVGEVTEPKNRGVLGCSLSVTGIVGSLAMNAYAPYLSIQTTAFISACFPVLALVTFMWMPESPYYLLMKGKIDEARKSLYFLRRCDIEKDLEVLKNDVDRQMSERGTWKDIFYIKSNRKAMLIMMGIRTVQQMSGISAWGLFTQTIFMQADGNMSPILSTCIYLFTQLIMTSCGSVLIDKYGRKPLLIFSCVGAGAVLNIGGIYFYLKEVTDFDTSSLNWIPIVVMVSFVIIFSIGLGTVPSLMLGELFSASIKGKGLCIMCIYYSLLISIFSKLFYYLTESYGMFASFFMFGMMSFFSVIFSYYFVPVLLSEDSHLNITSDETSYIVIIQPLGDIIGAPTAALLADLIGRKKGLLLLAIPTFVSWIFIAFAQNTLMFCIGRFISGNAFQTLLPEYNS